MKYLLQKDDKVEIKIIITIKIIHPHEGKKIWLASIKGYHCESNMPLYIKGVSSDFN